MVVKPGKTYEQDDPNSCCCKLLQKEIGIYVASKVWSLPFPRPYQYVAWWPWLKGYYGELAAGQTMTFEGLYPHCWVDQDLKKSMGY